MSYEVIRERTPFRGKLVEVRVDTVRMPDGSEADREVVTHPDSVAVVALDDHGRILLIRQYRHPLRSELWELPAGLRDEQGESAEQTAQRELFEETGFRADSWAVLLTLHPTPGMSNEAVTVFLATGLHSGDRPDRGAEEAHLMSRWILLHEACEEVFNGRITNGHTVAGLLALVLTQNEQPGTPIPIEVPEPTMRFSVADMTDLSPAAPELPEDDLQRSPEQDARHHRENSARLQDAVAEVVATHQGRSLDEAMEAVHEALARLGQPPQPERWVEAVAMDAINGRTYVVSQLALTDAGVDVPALDAIQDSTGRDRGQGPA
jgi:8-oxo-dGTP pyrophosphatase MutT (NUDIX family)